MATVFGVNRTIYNDPKQSDIVDSAINGGSIKYFYDTYVCAALPASDIIKVGPKLPAGSTVIDVIVQFDDLGTGTTLDVGDGHDADRYLDGVDTATAAGKSSMSGSTATIGPITGVGYVVGTNALDDQIQMTNLGAAATGTIKIMVIYATRG